MKNGKNHADEDELQKQTSQLVALRTGLLRKCQEHGDIFDPGQHDFQGACMVATFLVNSGDPLVASFEGDRARLLEMLRSICQSYEKTCPRCTPQAAK